MDRTEKQSFAAIPIILLMAFGIALAGSRGGTIVSGLPLYAICVILAFLIQWIALIPAYLRQMESFYDLTGALTFLTLIVTATVLTSRFDGRSVLLALLIIVWAIRLGTFLFLRIRSAGEDRRFREIKPSLAKFALAWTVQGLWVTFSLAAALAAITSRISVDLDVFALVGFIVWVVGFGIEVFADQQKSNFKKAPENEDKFIESGLWSWSRHPNYFGEIVLWIGISIIAFPVLRSWQYITLISPVFIYFQLTQISGIHILEAQADKKWGGQPEYEAYKARTSILFPLPPAEH